MVNHNGDHSDAKDQSPSSPATSRIDEEEFSDTLVADAKQTTPRTAFLRLRWKMLPIVALLVGLASTTTLWLTTAANETIRPRSDFSAGVVNIRDEIQERLNLHVQLMEGLQAFFQSSNDLSRAQFHNYLVTTHAFGRYPGIKAVQFARQITHDQKSNFERQVRHDASIESGAYADFSVTPPGERASYLVVEYNEPMEGNEAALGYDQAYQAARREAMERARDTGLPAASAPIEFLQDSDKRPGFVLYVPVYRTGMPIDSAERRRAAFAGQLSIVYVTEELINSVLTSSPELNRLSLTDQGIALAAIPAPGQTPKLLFDRDANRPDAKSATRESDWVDSLPVHIGGRVWELRASSSAPMTLFRPFPLTILLGGTAITILLWRILQVSMRQRHRAVLLARRMTRDLQNGVARLSAVVNTAVDSIVVIDAGGLIESVNPATERMFGYRSAEMLGCNVKMLMPDTFAVEHDQYVSNYLHTGQKKIIGIGRQVTCKRKDGTTFPADLAISELEVNGARKFTGILRDTTERMQAELALAAERDLVNSMLASLPDQIYFKDEHSRFLRINPGLARRYGLSDASAAIGKSDADFFSAEHAERTRVVERRIVESGEAVIDVEEREIWKDRPPTWNLTTKMPMRDSSGRTIGTFGISRDITARKLIEEQLRATNERFSLAADAAGIGVWEYDLQTGALQWDEWMYRLYGQPNASGAEPYALWADRLHADDRDRAEREVAACVAGEKDFDTEFRIVWPNGEVRHIKATATVRRDAAGVPARMVGINLDITARQKAEAIQAQFATIVASTNDAILSKNIDGLITSWNPAAQRMFGYSAREAIGRPMTLLVPPEHALDEAKMLAGIARGEHIDEFETRWVRKDGTRIQISASIAPIRNNAGEIVGASNIVREITRQKEQEKSLLDAMQKAEQANVAKGQFLANISHELRTPMSAILGMLKLLKSTELARRQIEYVVKTEQAAESLLQLLNNILDLSKIEAGKTALDLQPFCMNDLFREVSSILSSISDKRDVEILFDIDPAVPRWLMGDAFHLKRVLINLAANGIKFTEKGEVVLRVRRVPPLDSMALVEFMVRDTGIGIAQQSREALFQSFSQAEASTTRRYGGTGLGLAISQKLVQSMGGEITLESSVGAGSTFSFKLRFALAEMPSEAERAASGVAISSLRALIIDGNATARRILTDMARVPRMAGRRRGRQCSRDRNVHGEPRWRFAVSSDTCRSKIYQPERARHPCPHPRVNRQRPATDGGHDYFA